MRGGALLIGVAVVLAGCSGGEPSQLRTRGAPPASAECSPAVRLSPAPLPGETGVYRAGPLMLVTGEDLAQLPDRRLSHPSGSEAIAVLSDNHSAVLTVDPQSQARFSLQFTPLAGPGHPYAVISDGRPAVRFPVCPRRPHRFGGGILFAGKGCALLHVQRDGGAQIPMLIPIGNTFRGCPSVPAKQHLNQTSLPGLGVACPVANSIACDRVGIGVRLDRPATLVTVQVAGRLVSLSPPTDPRNGLWIGYLENAGLTRGPLDVHLPPGETLWFGEPSLRPHVRVTAFLADGTAATLSATDTLLPGFG